MARSPPRLGGGTAVAVVSRDFAGLRALALKHPYLLFPPNTNSGRKALQAQSGHGHGAQAVRGVSSRPADAHPPSAMDPAVAEGDPVRIDPNSTVPLKVMRMSPFFVAISPSNLPRPPSHVAGAYCTGGTTHVRLRDTNQVLGGFSPSQYVERFGRFQLRDPLRGRFLAPNSREPLPIENDLFSGHLVFIVRTVPADEKYGDYLHGKLRQFEMQALRSHISSPLLNLPMCLFIACSILSAYHLACGLDTGSIQVRAKRSALHGG